VVPLLVPASCIELYRLVNTGPHLVCFVVLRCTGWFIMVPLYGYVYWANSYQSALSIVRLLDTVVSIPDIQPPVLAAYFGMCWHLVLNPSDSNAVIFL
jgi:hypothetical protein